MEIVVQSMKILIALNVYFLDDWHDMLIISQYNLFFLKFSFSFSFVVLENEARALCMV